MRIDGLIRIMDEILQRTVERGDGPRVEDEQTMKRLNSNKRLLAVVGDDRGVWHLPLPKSQSTTPLKRSNSTGGSRGFFLEGTSNVMEPVNKPKYQINPIFCILQPPKGTNTYVGVASRNKYQLPSSPRVQAVV